MPARRPCILAGRGALGAGEELAAMAERLGAPDHQAAARQGARARRQSLSHRRHRPARHQAVAGGAGRLRHAADRRQLSFPYIEFYPKPGKARACRSRSIPKRIGLRYPVEAGLVGDTSTASCARCCRRLDQHEDRSFLEKAQKGMKEWNELMEERGTRQRQADEAAGRRARAQQAPRRRRHRRHRFRHHHHLDRAPSRRCAAT